MGKGRLAPDLVGQHFGRLTVMARDTTRAQAGKTPRAFWLCRCACGAMTSVGAAQLRGGYTRSCGCLSHDRFRAMVTKHGHRSAPEYSAWQGIRRRCRAATAGAKPRRDQRWYADITVCARWTDFANFLADMGPRPSPKHSVERIDNMRGYEPGNCRWATQREQMRNTRRQRLVAYRGRTQPLMDWAAELGLSYYVLHGRLYRLGWSVERAFNTPTLSR